ncbi:MAG TPA: tRNA (adenosine(37)-N6)-dimethylallyltransferase MiaA [Flavobacteriales bacterium]|nr:tRNA (adenosine(37)-N6)-dimethylallyltransferase MiaA [Flavobacteriales bacterium]
MQESSDKTVVGITGATATGKTGVSIQIAKHYQCPVVSFDSRQFYQELAISSAAPTVKEMNGVPHYFISSHSLKNPINAAQYSEAANKLVKNLFKENETIVMVGGSGLYLSAFLSELNTLPDAHQNIRKNLNRIFETKGIQVLSEMMRCYDPDYYQIVDRRNPHRLIRGLEVCMQSGLPYSDLIKASEKGPMLFNFIGIHLTEVKAMLEQRIAQRTNEMLQRGLIHEVKSIHKLKLNPPLQSIGYDEITLYLNGQIPLKEAKTRININTIAYAKRQVTWFRKKGYREFHHSQKKEILDFLAAGTNTSN